MVAFQHYVTFNVAALLQLQIWFVVLVDYLVESVSCPLNYRSLSPLSLLYMNHLESF